MFGSRLVFWALLLFAPPAAAGDNITGPVEDVIDGATLTVAGTTVRLWGIRVPALSETCAGADGDTYPCGRKSRLALATLTAREDLICTPVVLGRFRCRLRGIDVASMMVSAGQAMVDVGGEHYAEEQENARQAGLGLWVRKEEGGTP